MQRMGCVAVDPEMTSQAIARTAGHEPERRGRAGQRRGDFVQGAIAPDGDDESAVVGERLAGECNCMPRAGRLNQRGAMPRRVYPNGGKHTGHGAGARIDDEARLQPTEKNIWLALWRDWKRFLASPWGGNLSWLRSMKPILRVLTGCTAVGKTEWALRWAESRRAEIVSCDSLLFYRGVDIGSAKPTAAELARVPHHLIDICAVTERMDVVQYVKRARAAVEEITARGREVLVVGGSGFYLKCFFAPVADEVAVSAALRAEVVAMPLVAAVARLRELNKDGLGALDTANPRRVTRALERCLASGRTLSALAAEFAQRPAAFADWSVDLTSIERSPEELAARIAARVGAMLRDGLVNEVRQLLESGLRSNPSVALAIGYREVLDVIEGRLPESQLADEISKNTRALVKKQRTWFRTQLPPHRLLDAASLTDSSSLFPG